MRYRVDRLNNIFIRLNDDGSMLMIKIETLTFGKKRVSRVYTEEGFNENWSVIYNNYSHSNKREFEEAEKNAKI